MSAVLSCAPTDADGCAPLLCRLMWARCIALYPDLRAGEGIGVINPHAVDYADLRPLLVAERDAIYRYLCDSLTPQDACELAAFNGFAEGAIASMLRRVVARRGLPAATWTDAFVAQMVAHAIDQADRYPEEWIRLGGRRDPWAPLVPFDEEIAATVFQADGDWGDAFRVLARRRDAHALPVGDQELEQRLQGAYALLYGDMGGCTWSQHRLRILRRDY